MGRRLQSAKRTMLAAALAASASDTPDGVAYAEVWRVAEPGHGTPLVTSRAVYYIARAYELVAVDRARGTVRWQAQIEPPSVPAGLSVFDAGSRVITGVDALQAFDTRHGAEVWRVPGLGRYAGALHGRAVLCGSIEGRLVSVNIDEGRVQWSRDLGRGVPAFSPRIDAAGGVVAFAAQAEGQAGGVAAFDPSTGEVRWAETYPADPRVGSGWRGGPLLAGRWVVMADASGRLLGIDRDSGALRWRVDGPANGPGAVPVQDYRAMTANGHMIFTASMNGSVDAYRLMDDGAPVRIWRYYDPNNGSAGFGLVVARGRLWCPFVGGLVVLDAEVGRALWRAPETVAGNALPPAVGGRRVYAASDAGLVALRDGGRR